MDLKQQFTISHSPVFAGWFLCWFHPGSLPQLHSAGGSAGLEGPKMLSRAHLEVHACSCYVTAYILCEEFLTHVICVHTGMWTYSELDQLVYTVVSAAFLEGDGRSDKASLGLGSGMHTYCTLSPHLLVKRSPIQGSGLRLHLLMGGTAESPAKEWVRWDGTSVWPLNHLSFRWGSTALLKPSSVCFCRVTGGRWTYSFKP